MLKLIIACLVLLLAVWIWLLTLKSNGDAEADDAFHDDGIQSESTFEQEAIAEDVTTDRKNFVGKIFKNKGPKPNIQYVEIDWKILANLNAETGKFPKDFEFLDNSNVIISGYVTPLSERSPEKISEFFFSPFVGTSIDVPPPPQNQTIHVILDQPVPFPGIWDLVTIHGKLSVTEYEIHTMEGTYYAKANFIIRNGVVIPNQSE